MSAQPAWTSSARPGDLAGPGVDEPAVLGAAGHHGPAVGRPPGVDEPVVVDRDAAGAGRAHLEDDDGAGLGEDEPVPVRVDGARPEPRHRRPVPQHGGAQRRHRDELGLRGLPGQGQRGPVRVVTGLDEVHRAHRGRAPGRGQDLEGAVGPWTQSWSEREPRGVGVEREQRLRERVGGQEHPDTRHRHDREPAVGGARGRRRTLDGGRLVPSGEHHRRHPAGDGHAPAECDPALDGPVPLTCTGPRRGREATSGTSSATSSSSSRASSSDGARPPRWSATWADTAARAASRSAATSSPGTARVSAVSASVRSSSQRRTATARRRGSSSASAARTASRRRSTSAASVSGAAPGCGAVTGPSVRAVVAAETASR